MITPEEQKRIDEQLIESLRKKWGAPDLHAAHHKNVKLAGSMLASFERFKNSKRGFTYAMVGGRAHGKTQVAVELMFDRTSRQKSARFVTATAFFLEIQDSYKKDSEFSAKDVVDKYSRCSLLVIDECGKRKPDSQWENNLFFEVVNSRYNAMKDTLFIDNNSPEEFAKSVGDSIMSRINECGGVIVTDNWPTFRPE